MKYFADYSKQDQEVLKEICPDASEVHFNYYLRVCDSKNISPFSGLMYLTLRSSKGKIKASVAPTVDGSRLSASRSGEYAGSDEPEYDSEDNKTPKWCRVTVYRMSGGERRAYTAKCRYDEMKPASGQDYMWNQKPYHMLAKVVEVQALRKAFPDYVYGAGDEEDNSEVFEDTVPDTANVSVEDAAQRDRIMKFQIAVQAFSAFGFNEEQVMKELGISTRQEIKDEHLDALRTLYQEHKADKQESKF